MSFELPAQRVIIGGKKYSSCILRLDRSTMKIEVICRVGFISKKNVKMLEIEEKPLDLLKSVKAGKILWRDASVEIAAPQASSLAGEIRRYIIEKSSMCISKHMEIFRNILTERVRVLKEITEITLRPREKLIEYSKKVGEETIASSEDTIENTYSLIKGGFKEKISEAIKSPPECPDTPSRIIDRVLRTFSEIIDIQSAIYMGLRESDIVAKIEKIGEIMGGLSEENRKRFLEALEARDLEKSSEALLNALQITLSAKIDSLVSQETG